MVRGGYSQALVEGEPHAVGHPSLAQVDGAPVRQVLGRPQPAPAPVLGMLAKETCQQVSRSAGQQASSSAGLTACSISSVRSLAVQSLHQPLCSV